MPFSQTLLKKFKITLEKDQKRLESEITKLVDKPSGEQSEEDNAQLLERFQENIALKKNLLKILENVKRALEKIQDGSYGVCDRCRLEIQAERLEIYPASIICIRCESKQAKRWWLPWRR